MRNLVVPTLLLFLAVSAGCDTTQPAQVEGQMATVTVTAVNALVPVVTTWMMFEDANPQDGMPDDINADGEGDVFLWCDPFPSPRVADSVPWPFSMQISVIPEGEVLGVTVLRGTTAPESATLYDVSSVDHFTSKNTSAFQTRDGRCSNDADRFCNPDNTDTSICTYDMDMPDPGVLCDAVGNCSGDGTLECFPDNPLDTTCADAFAGTCEDTAVNHRYVFPVPGERLTAANREVLDANFNVFFGTDPARAAVAGPTAGLCPGFDLGDARIAGEPQPFSFDVVKGDTIVIEARAFDEAPPGIPFVNQPGLAANLVLDGTPANVTGSTAAQPGSENPIQFFFTLK